MAMLTEDAEPSSGSSAGRVGREHLQAGVEHLVGVRRVGDELSICGLTASSRLSRPATLVRSWSSSSVFFSLSELGEEVGELLGVALLGEQRR